MSIKERFLQACREHSWLGVEYILKGGFGKSYIPLGRIHREINEVIDKAKEEAKKVGLGLLKPHEAKRGALIQIPRDHGKCMVGDTLVVLADGSLKKAIDCRVGDEVIAFDETSFKFAKSKIVDVFDNGVKPVYRIVLSNGMEVEVTSNHPFFTVEGWKSLDAGLDVGDYVAVPLYIPRFNVRKVFSDNQLKILAYLIAEGSTRTKSVKFTNSVKEIVEDLDKALRGEFSLSLKKIGNKKYEYGVVGNGKKGCKKDFLDFLKRYGLFGKYSYEKRIPEEIFVSPIEDICLFLRCLWLCDGSIATVKRVNSKKAPNEVSIYYSTSSKVMAKQIQILLSYVGIPSSILRKKTKCRDNFVVKVTGTKKHKLMFLDMILRKKYNGEDVYLFTNKKPPSMRGGIEAYTKVAHESERIMGSGLVDRPVGIRLFQGANSLRSSFLQEGAVHEPDNNELSKILHSDVYWSRITKIEYVGEKPTIGLEVDQYHSHITNGIVTHNTSLILARVLWELGKNPNLLIKIVCASEEQAKKRIAFLRQHIEQNKNLKELFPHLRPHPNLSWSTTQLFVDRSLISVDPSVEACGVLGTHTGSHCIAERTLIITNEGLKPIEEIEVGDFVYSITGRFEKVIAKLLHPYKGKVYYIQSEAQNSLLVGMTPEHKILVRHVDCPKIEWIQVEQIAKNPEEYLLVFPKPEFVEIPEVFQNEFEWQTLKELSSSISTKFLSDDLFFYLPIKRIQTKDYDGIVYDIQVDNGHSFCSLFVTLLNCNLIVFDDIVDFKSAFVYPENLKKIESAVKENWMNILTNDGWFVMIFTPWTKEDVTLKMKEQTDLYYVYERMIDENYTPVWEERYPREALIQKEKEIGKTAFLRAYRGIIPESTSIFSREAILSCYDYNYSFGEYPPDTQFFIGVDLGHRKTQGSPETCIFVLGLTPDKRRIPVSIKVGNFSSTETARILLQEALKYKPNLIYVENNGYQQALLDWIKTLDPSADQLPIEGYFTGSQKMNIKYGIPALASEFEKDLWIIPAKNLDKHDEFCRCGLCVWLRQLENFPAGLTDTVIACWLARQAILSVTEATVNIRFLNFEPDEFGEVSVRIV